MKTFRPVPLRSVLLTTALVAGGMLISTSVALAQPAPAHAWQPPSHGITWCSGNLGSGTYSGLEVRGTCTVPDSATVIIRGDLIIDPGSNFNAETLATVTISGDVRVGSGANFGLGCSPATGDQCQGQFSHDVVRGSIVGDHPYAMQIDGSTIEGTLAVHGGQDLTCDSPPDTARGGAPSNFPIKDNTIRGGVLIDGWTGCWFGFIRNTVHGLVLITDTHGVQTAGPNGPLDSTEVDSNTVTGILACYGNTPHAQIGDSGGSPNVVRGLALGECSAPLSVHHT